MRALTAKIVAGHGMGKRLGYPTLNLAVPADFDLAAGVYACRAELGNNSVDGVLFFGTRATFGDSDPTLEVHLFVAPPADLNKLTVQIFDAKLLRPPAEFADEAELKQAIAQDIVNAKALLKTVQ